MPDRRRQAFTQQDKAQAKDNRLEGFVMGSSPGVLSVAEEERTESKRELVKRLEAEFERWKKLLDGLSEQQVVGREMPSELSIKDVVAHLMAWQQLSVARLEAAINNAEPRYHLGPEGLDPDADENVDRINAWIHETYANEPWSTIYWLWREGFQRFIELSKAMPEEAMMQPARYTWLRDAPLARVLISSYEHHHDEHYKPLVQWLRDRGYTVEQQG